MGEPASCSVTPPPRVVASPPDAGVVVFVPGITGTELRYRDTGDTAWGTGHEIIARVVDGELFEPGDFGEFFVFLGRMSVVTEFVGVINDGSNGEAAVVRAQGRPAGTPFLERLLGRVLSRDFSRIPTAIDYLQ